MKTRKIDKRSARYEAAAYFWAPALMLLSLMRPVLAGPPFLSDDPLPTDLGHFEIYAFSDGTSSHDGRSGQAGIDFNYGAGPDLQLTAVLPLGYDAPIHGSTTVSLGNVQLAAKFRFMHQQHVGWDVAVFPRLFLPSGANAVGEQHASFFLPLWVGKEWDQWSTFGGGGCEFNEGAGSKNFCVAGWVLNRNMTAKLQLGAEIFHQTADTLEGKDSTMLGTGVRYDLDDAIHLLSYLNTTLQNPTGTRQCSWYAAVLFTF